MNIRVFAIAAVVALVIGFAGGWIANGWRMDAQLSSSIAGRAEDSASVSNTAAAESESQSKNLQSQITAIAALDSEGLQELSNAKATNQRLTAAVDNGTVRLSINAAYPVCRDSVPGATATAGMVDGASVELAPTARPTYNALIDALAADQIKIEKLQRYILDIQSTGKSQ